ncbi:MAG: thiamine pyrophosphate-dependent enzyme, partial [Candidatus Ranarchaeia archaeon]|jgi:acetolactate synthase-1/2/3 large subunit
LSIIGDAKYVANEMTKRIGKFAQRRTNSAWTKRVSKFKKECDCLIDVSKGQITQQGVMQILNKLIAPKDIVVTGVGQHQMFASHFLKRDNPRTFITSGGAGTMGFGLPAAIGAKVAAPHVHVIDVDGDGSFNMTAQELATCKMNNIKVVPIIMNNGYLGMVRQWLELFFDRRYSSVELGRNPDFVKLAEAYKLTGTQVTRANHFEETLQNAMKSEETHVIDCHVPEEENILPMIPPGGNPQDSIGGCMVSPGKFFRGGE